MPLYPNARVEIRRNLRRIQKGKSARLITIGRLTAEQLAALNARREAQGLPPVDPEVVFRGKHPYESRVIRDGYTIDDVTDQICNGMDAASVVLDSSGSMTEMENPNPRADRYGNNVRDRIVFECTARRRPDVFNVIPKGDRIKPTKEEGEAVLSDASPRNSSDSAG